MLGFSEIIVSKNMTQNYTSLIDMPFCSQQRHMAFIQKHTFPPTYCGNIMTMMDG